MSGPENRVKARQGAQRAEIASECGPKQQEFLSKSRHLKIDDSLHQLAASYSELP
jgi:hypothetical protein